MRKRRSVSRKAHRPLSTAKRIELTLRSIPKLLLICLAIWMCFAFARKLVRPVYLYCRENREIAQIERDLKALQIENVKLKKQKDYLKTPEGAQTEARKLGYVRPGEISIMIQKQPPVDTTR